MSRTFVIGDIHGGLKALYQILERANVTPNDHLIFLGDYVDGWSESAQVIQFLMDLNETYNCIFMRGNHDVMAYKWLKNGIAEGTWLRHGGVETKASYTSFSKKQQLKHVKFLESHKNYYVDDQNRLFVHAGFTSMHGPKKTNWDEECYWDRTLWEMALSLHGRTQRGDEFYPKRLLLFKEIFIEHTPVTRINKTTPQNAMNVWNIDTGACFKGPLTIMDIDSKEYWQSDPVWTLYPDEDGRNKTG